MNHNHSSTDDIIHKLNNIAEYLYSNAVLYDFTIFRNGIISVTYKLDEYYITVRKDANCKAYSVKVQLKKYSTLDGYINKDLIASSNGELPF